MRIRHRGRSRTSPPARLGRRHRPGLTPVGIAELASFNAAAHFGLDHEIGSIAPGRRADIAVFDALSATYPAFVIAGGAIVARQGFLEASSPEGAGR